MSIHSHGIMASLLFIGSYFIRYFIFSFILIMIVISDFLQNFNPTTSSLSNLAFIEAVTQRCSVKKVFLEILQNSQENTCARVSF